MFEKWNLPSNICSLYAISRENLSFYVDREDISKDILKSIKVGANCCLLEGEIGVGKTSIGNYARFSSGFFTPTLELKVRSSWSREDFLFALISSIIVELLRTGNSYTLINDKELNVYYKKYLDYESSGYGISFKGFGANKTANSLSRAKITEVQLENDLNNVASLIMKKLNQKNPIIIQLNNLDINDGMNKDELKKFLNDSQEWFKNERFTWILTAKKGFSEFIRKEVPRFKQMVSKTIFVDYMPFPSFLKVFDARIANEGYGGDIQSVIDRSLLELVYKNSNYILRDSLNTIGDVLMMYDDQEYLSKMVIGLDDIKKCFQVKYQREISEIQKITHATEILQYISSNPNCNQSQLIKSRQNKINQPNAVRLLSVLEEKNIVKKEKVNKSNHYTLIGEYDFIF